MNLSITLPQDAVPQENPHRRAEMPVVPRVGELIGYSDLPSMLVVTEVHYYVERVQGPMDVGSDCTIVCDWKYEEGDQDQSVGG